MKKIIILSFTRNGSALNAQLQTQLNNGGYACEGYTIERFSSGFFLNAMPGSLMDWVGERWGSASFVFIGAAAIAVRTIAPCVDDKFTDSAVVVVDESGKYVIPLLSTHIGGGGQLAEDIAKYIQAQLVITTATDVQNKFAVDVFSKKNNLKLSQRKLAKDISAAVLENETIGFYSQFPMSGNVPENLEICKQIEDLNNYKYGIAVADKEYEHDNPKVLHLTPVSDANIVVGIGCRRGTEESALEAALDKLLNTHAIEKNKLQSFASIDLKKDEEGLISLARKLDIQLVVYDAQSLGSVKTVSSESDFVNGVTGIGNVCERAAMYHCPDGRLIQPKKIIDGITFALVKDNLNITF